MMDLNDVQAFVSKATSKELDKILLSVYAERKKQEEEKKNQLAQNFFDAWQALTDAGYYVYWGGDFDIEQGDNFMPHNVYVDEGVI